MLLLLLLGATQNHKRSQGIRFHSNPRSLPPVGWRLGTGERLSAPVFPVGCKTVLGVACGRKLSSHLIFPSVRRAGIMANGALEIAAMCLSLIGLIGAAASTGMPMWRVTAFIGENIIVMETRYEGLWMNCYRQANIRMQCKVYDSLLALPPDLQAARGLMCCAVAMSAIGLLIAIAGMKCTACIQGNDRAKRMVLIVAGSMILIGCLCCIVPVSWTGHVIIQDFYNPLLIDAQRRELGEALYIGWVSAALLFAGGCIFTCCNVSSDKGPDQRYSYNRNAAPFVAYQPQPVVFHPQPRSVYSHPSGPPSFIQQPSYDTSRQQSFAQPSRHPSARSAVAYL